MSFQIVHYDDTRRASLATESKTVMSWLRFNFSWGTRKRLYEMMIPRLREGTGMTPERLFDLFAARLRRQKRIGAAQAVERVLYEMRDDGKKLAAALKPLIPLDEYQLIEAGEDASDVASALELAVEMRERNGRIRWATLRCYGSMLFYVSLVFIALKVIAVWAMPALQQLAKLAKGPKSEMDQDLDALISFVNGNGALWCCAALLVAIALITASLTLLTGPLRTRLETLPPWSTYRNIQGYIWLSSFVALVRAGQPETRVLQRQIESASPWLRERLAALADRLSQHAMLLPQALEHCGFKFPSPDMIEDISNSWGGKDGGYDRLLRSSRTWAAEIERAAISRAKLIETLGMLFVQAVAGFISLAAMNYGSIQ